MNMPGSKDHPTHTYSNYSKQPGTLKDDPSPFASYGDIVYAQENDRIQNFEQNYVRLLCMRFN